MSTPFALLLISLMMLPLPWMISYSGSKPLATSTPIFDLGRSLMWPTEAFTSKPLPRYFLMVLALAGDSTITSAVCAPPDEDAERADFVFADALAVDLTGALAADFAAACFPDRATCAG